MTEDISYMLMVSDMVYVKCWNKKTLFTCLIISMYVFLSIVCNS